jgi:hypothetical protein
MPWIMEIVTTCPSCRGAGLIGEWMCPDCCGDKRVWLPVNSASEGRVYAYDDERHARHILRICYGTSTVGTARVREVDVVPAPKTVGPGRISKWT